MFKILCDFDGTVTLADTADAIFTAFCPPEWREIETLWETGEIGSAECMRRQMELVDASLPGINKVLDAIEIDETFPAFARFCVSEGLDLTIVSDGIDHFIQRILRPYGLSQLPIKANRLIKLQERRFSLAHPNQVKDCAAGAGTCKCHLAARRGGSIRTVLIGDGRSDFCVSHEADIVFAKKSLLSYAAEQAIPAIAFTSFRDVQQAMIPLIETLGKHGASALPAAF